MGRVRNAELSRYFILVAWFILFLCGCFMVRSGVLGSEPEYLLVWFWGSLEGVEILLRWAFVLSIDIAIHLFFLFLWCTFTHVLSLIFHLSSRMDSDSEKDGPESEEEMQDLYPLEGKYKDEADKRESVELALF